MKISFLVLLAMIALPIMCTITLHNPRGSNNRLNGNKVETENPYRLFNSQSDAKSGYCWGPEPYYYANSKLLIQWTQSQSCSFEEQCNIIIQYRCDPFIRDGVTSDTIPQNIATYNNKLNPNPLTGKEEDVYEYGMHEDYNYYEQCSRRQRNKGLFTAGETLEEHATSTRQSPQGEERYGYECPEERDYYPYWHPSPWKDIAVFVTENAMCEYLQQNSQNVKSKNLCTIAEVNNEEECMRHEGTWNEVPSWGIPQPDCQSFPIPTLINGRNIYSYWWNVPPALGENEHCVIRVRLNISSSDYNGWPMTKTDGSYVDYRWNDDSPVRVDPTLEYYGVNITLTVNPQWYGRTMEDRSFTFKVKNDLPSYISKDADSAIYNLNVQGKRGTGSQTFPNLPYSFVPNVLAVSNGDYVHFQWTGCDSNPLSFSGSGMNGTDRSNIVQIPAENSNFPSSSSYFNQLFEDDDVQRRFAYLDQKDCLSIEELDTINSGDMSRIQNDAQNCMVLNGVSTPYFDGGIFRMNTSLKYNFMSSRNNNFGANTQKCTIIVSDRNLKDYMNILQNNTTTDGQFTLSHVITISVTSIALTMIGTIIIILIVKSKIDAKREKAMVLRFDN